MKNDKAAVRQATELTRLGQIARGQGDREAALTHYRAAVEIWRGESNAGRLAHTVRHVADILLELGRLPEAEPLYAEALGIYRAETGTGVLDLANTIRGYAILLDGMGRRQDAITMFEEARDLYEEVGVAHGAAEMSRRLEVAAKGGSSAP